MAKVLLKGNEALAEAALAAGCRFYSGYPVSYTHPRGECC